MFANTRYKLKMAFKNVRKDINEVAEEHMKLKLSMNEWVQYLHSNQRVLETRIKALEDQIRMQR